MERNGMEVKTGRRDAFDIGDNMHIMSTLVNRFHTQLKVQYQARKNFIKYSMSLNT